MKKSLFLAFALFSILSARAQDKKEEEPLQYPFDETGVEQPRGVYGSDDRKEVKDAEGIKDFVRATAVMISKDLIKDNKVFGYTLREQLTYKYGSSNFDKNVKFLDQPTSATCTGFLIAPDILATAGHCVKELKDTKNYVWIFDYTNELKYHDTYKYIEVDPNNMYEVAEVLTAKLDSDSNDDYSILRLKRESDRAPYRFRTSGKVGLYSSVSTIGSPTGLPLKFADNATVVDNSQPKWFKNSIDTFPGNSGGPVFSPNGFIEGIHVRGAVTQAQDGSLTGDYMYDEDCDCIKTVEFSSAYWTAGAQAHRITSIPYDILHKAIYENIEYAIKNHLDDRLNSWIVYSWMINHEYTNKRGRFEYLAAKYNNLYALKTIFEKSKAESLDKYGHDLMLYAIDNNNPEMVSYIMDHVSFFEILNSNNQSPLFYALNNNKPNLVLTMLNNGWDANSVDSNGNNLLHLAAYKNDLSLIKALSSRNISASKTNKNGKKPEDIAKANKNKSARKFLKKLRKKQK